ncbi:MAG: TonB-dependent receptor domain-containing protein [Mangrovibacterium sp.]
MLKRITRRYIAVCFCFWITALSAQETKNKITGKVTDPEGLAIPDVYIYMKEFREKACLTDQEGNFMISCPEGTHTLVFSHAAYETFEKEITVRHSESGRRYYEICLKKKSISIGEVVVSGQAFSTAPSLESIKRIHRLIAGGTSVAVMQPEVQRLETLKDALKLEPGVIIQEFFGANDQPRLSIRGSGIQSNPQRRGVYLLQDGIPVNFADGSFIIGVMDPSISESAEVFKGANALRYGAATLGGAVNFNSHTGRYTPGIQVKTEDGSYGYGSFSALLGDSWGKKDAFLSVSGSRQDGFRRHNQNKKLNVAGNFGYRIADHIDNRTYLNYSYIYFDVPGPLTMDMIEEDPSQINKGIDLPYYMGPNIERDKPGREATVMRAANRTAFRLSQSTDLTVSLYYQYIKDRFVFPIALSTQRSAGNDAGISIQAVHRMRKSTLTAGFLESHGNIDRRGHINKNGLDSYMFSKDKLNAVNLTFYIEYDYTLNRRTHIIADLQAVNNERNSEDVFPNPGLRPWYSQTSHKYRYFYSQSISLDQQFKALNPRIGAIYNAGENSDVQFFGNVSTSYEPPTFDELVGTAVTDNINTSPKKLFAIRLDKQSAVTAELGSRHEGARCGWNFSLYRSWVHNELLEVKDFVLGVKKTENYPHTIHQGIELGFKVIPLQGIFSAAGKDRLILHGMYTYSDFYFSSGEYRNNKLAGVPPHYLTGFLEYKYPGKLFVSLNVESEPIKSPIDHTNTVYQPAYTIYGFRAGVDGWKNFSFYAEGKNIFNRHYASSYIISDQILLPPIPFPQFTVDNVAFFMPGQTRAFYVGLSYRFGEKK